MPLDKLDVDDDDAAAGCCRCPVCPPRPEDDDSSDMSELDADLGMQEADPTREVFAILIAVVDLLDVDATAVSVTAEDIDVVDALPPTDACFLRGIFIGGVGGTA